jgi:hypothetical protein
MNDPAPTKFQPDGLSWYLASWSVALPGGQDPAFVFASSHIEGEDTYRPDVLFPSKAIAEAAAAPHIEALANRLLEQAKQLRQRAADDTKRLRRLDTVIHWLPKRDGTSLWHIAYSGVLAVSGKCVCYIRQSAPGSWNSSFRLENGKPDGGLKFHDSMEDAISYCERRVQQSEVTHE